MDNHKTITELQQHSGATFFASCVGKTSLSPDSDLYMQTVQMSEILVSEGFGIIHGGYQDGNNGGTMQAYAQGAYNAIIKHNLPASYNIGVPESRFDAKWGIGDRTSYNTQFCLPYDHIDERCGAIVDHGDILVANTLAGNGTLREVFTRYERNDIHKATNLGTGPIKPMVLFGDNWKELFTSLTNNFALGTPVPDDNNIFFVTNLDDFKNTIQYLRENVVTNKQSSEQ